MSTLTISLPEEMRRFIEGRLKSGNFASTSEYIRQLIRQEQHRAQRDKLQGLLIEGLESGEPIEVNEQYLRELPQRIRSKVSGKRRGRKNA